MPGASINYRGVAKFPPSNQTGLLNQQPVIGNQSIKGGYNFSDQTKNNYRHLIFQTVDGVTTKILLKGYTIYKQYIEETITLNGIDPVISTNIYNSWDAIPEADISSLNIGVGDGMTDLFFYDGSPSSHRIILDGSGPTFTILGLLNYEPMSKAQLDKEAFPLDTNLNEQTTTTTNAVMVQTVAQRFFMKVLGTTNDSSLTWYFNTQSLN